MSDPSYPPADRSVKVPHLVLGLLFLGVAAIWALGASDAIDAKHLAVLAPVVLIGAGVIGLVASLASGRNRRTRHQYADNTTDPTTPLTVDDGDESTEEIR